MGVLQALCEQFKSNIIMILFIDYSLLLSTIIGIAYLLVLIYIIIRLYKLTDKFKTDKKVKLEPIDFLLLFCFLFFYFMQATRIEYQMKQIKLELESTRDSVLHYKFINDE